MTEAQFHRQSAQQVPERTGDSSEVKGLALDAILADIVGALENVRGVLENAAENFRELDRSEPPSRSATTLSR